MNDVQHDASLTRGQSCCITELNVPSTAVDSCEGFSRSKHDSIPERYRPHRPWQILHRPMALLIHPQRTQLSFLLRASANPANNGTHAHTHTCSAHTSLTLIPFIHFIHMRLATVYHSDVLLVPSIGCFDHWRGRARDGRILRHQDQPSGRQQQQALQHGGFREEGEAGSRGR